MKKFVAFILTLIVMYVVLQDQNNIYYIGVRDNTSIGVLFNDSYWMKLICWMAIVGLLLACVFALLFGWEFKEFAVAMTALAICFCCVVGLLKIKANGMCNAIVKTVEETKGDKIKKYNQISTYCENLSLNEMIEIANRADFRYVVGLKNIDADSFNKAVAKVYNTSFDIKTTSVRSIHHRINEEMDREFSFDKKAKQIKEAYKEYNKLEKQSKKNAEKLEAKQLKEAAKNSGKKAWDAFKDGARKLSDTLDPIFGDN